MLWEDENVLERVVGTAAHDTSGLMPLTVRLERAVGSNSARQGVTFGGGAE